MATKSNVYKAYSMEYGTFVGLGWGALFLCYVGGICTNNAVLFLLAMALCGVCLMMPFFFAVRLNRKLFAAGDKLSYLQGVFFSFSMFMYACLMNALIVFAYFKLFDNGTLCEQLTHMVTLPEMVTMYQQIGMSEQYQMMLDMLKDINNMSAFEKTLAVFHNNFFFGIIMSFIVAVAASYNLNGTRVHEK